MRPRTVRDGSKPVKRRGHEGHAVAKNARFGKGSACYTCGSCGKRTRDVNREEGQAGLCARCYEKAEDENAVYDGYMTQDEFDAKWNVAYQAYFKDTGEPVGVPQDTKMDAARVAREHGVTVFRTEIRKLVKKDGAWVKA